MKNLQENNDKSTRRLLKKRKWMHNKGNQEKRKQN